MFITFHPSSSRVFVVTRRNSRSIQMFGTRSLSGSSHTSKYDRRESSNPSYVTVYSYDHSCLTLQTRSLCPMRPFVDSFLTVTVSSGDFVRTHILRVPLEWFNVCSTLLPSLLGCKGCSRVHSDCEGDDQVSWVKLIILEILESLEVL